MTPSFRTEAVDRYVHVLHLSRAGALIDAYLAMFVDERVKGRAVPVGKIALV